AAFFLFLFLFFLSFFLASLHHQTSHLNQSTPLHAQWTPAKPGKAPPNGPADNSMGPSDEVEKTWKTFERRVTIKREAAKRGSVAQLRRQKYLDLGTGLPYLYRMRAWAPRNEADQGWGPTARARRRAAG